MERPQDYVLRRVEERGIRLIRLWFTDVHGQLKSFAISPAELETAFEQGMVFDGSSIDGFSRVAEEDTVARPDPATFELMRWTGSDDNAARMFCDIERADGSPYPGDSRQVLRRAMDQARQAGFTFFTAPEMEYFLFERELRDGRPVPLDNGSYFDLTTADVASDVRRRTLTTLEAMGIPVEYSFHEDAPSQHEIDLRYTDALTMADNVMTFRLIVREIALGHGAHATFMPKPLAGVQGSGMHTHLSLFRDGTNAFHDPDSPDGLSEVARCFIAGLLHHAREITAVTNQLVNSYKRLITGYEAPVAVSWGHSNRAALIRVPTTRSGNPEESTRIEYRAPDPACNPYLAFAVILAAGMRGIERGYELPLEAPPSMTGYTEHGGLLHQDELPGSLAEALDEMEKSELVAETLGDHLFRWFLRNKRREWSDYKGQVTPFELDRYYASL
jgi:glutamine synthetase